MADYSPRVPVLALAARRGRASGLLVDHQRVVEAVARHDPSAAETAVLEHIDHLIDDVLSYCRSHPDGFDARTVQVLSKGVPGVPPDA